MTINNIKTVPQSIGHLNDIVLGRDPETGILVRVYEGDKPLQDRVSDLEWELFDRLLINYDVTELIKEYPQYDETNTGQLKIEIFLNENPDYTNHAAGTSLTLEDARYYRDQTGNIGELFVNAKPRGGNFDTISDASLYLWADSPSVPELTHTWFAFYRGSGDYTGYCINLYRKVKRV